MTDPIPFPIVHLSVPISARSAIPLPLVGVPRLRFDIQLVPCPGDWWVLECGFRGPTTYTPGARMDFVALAVGGCDPWLLAGACSEMLRGWGYEVTGALAEAVGQVEDTLSAGCYDAACAVGRGDDLELAVATVVFFVWLADDQLSSTLH